MSHADLRALGQKQSEFREQQVAQAAKAAQRDLPSLHAPEGALNPVVSWFSAKKETLIWVADAAWLLICNGHREL